SDERIAFSALKLVDATRLTAQVTVPGNVPPGAYDVIVSEGADSATCRDCLVVAKTDTLAEPLPLTQQSPAAPAVPTARLELVRGPAVIRGHRVRFTVRCLGGACRGEATGAGVTTARFTLASGTTRRVTLRLNRRGRAQLKRAGRVRLTLTISQIGKRTI